MAGGPGICDRSGNVVSEAGGGFPQRWLVLGSHIPPGGGLGGMIRYTVEVIRSLEQRPDVEVHVHCRPETAPFLCDELGVARQRLHTTARGSTVIDSLVERFALGRLADRLGAEVILGTKQLLPRRSNRERVYAASGVGVGSRRVLTVHDMLPLDRPRDFGLAKRLMLPQAYRRSVADADVLACVSSASRDRLVHHLPAASASAVVIPNAMTSLLSEVPPLPIAELADRRFALMVGDRSARKNAGFVVDLWPEVVKRVPDAVLAMAGPPGWGRNESLPGLAPLLSDGRVVELGRIDDGALRWAYQQALVTLCPSLLEGFGLPVLEAMTLGCPTIISADPAQVEAANGGATVVPLGRRREWIDAIVDHLQRRQRRPAVPTSRTWDAVADELVAAAAAVGPPISPSVDTR